MELWIRSQDKTELVKIEEICINIDEDGFVGIWSYGSNKHLKYYLGNYKTKERALHILDEIHQLLIDLQTLEIEPSAYKTINRNISCVYEMPEK